MEPAVEKRFQRIEAILRESAEHSAERNRQADLRMDKFEKQLQATRKLVEAGIKLVSRLAVEIRELRREVSEVSRIQKAMLRTYTNGKNGHS